MSIFIGSSAVSAVYIGSSAVSAVYQGSTKIWPLTAPGPTFTFYDNFERSSIGSSWSGSGGLIDGTAPHRHLKKNTSAGQAEYWTTQNFSSDNLAVHATIGPVHDSQQAASILIGSSSNYIFCEFSQSHGILGYYNGGSSWPQLANFGGQPWTDGDTLIFKRSGNTITVQRNSTVLATASSSQAKGVGKRKIALGVRMNEAFWTKWYGPTFDDVGVAVS